MALVLVFVGAARAETNVYIDGQIVFAAIGDDGDAGSLYESLLIKAVEQSQGLVKTFRSSDRRIEISCTKTTQAKYSCYFAVNLGKTTKRNEVTSVVRDGSVLRAHLKSVFGHDKLYQLLDVEERKGRSRFVRVYETADSNAEIYCLRSVLSAQFQPTTCTISLKLPQELTDAAR